MRHKLSLYNLVCATCNVRRGRHQNDMQGELVCPNVDGRYPDFVAEFKERFVDSGRCRSRVVDKKLNPSSY